jgi:hypothetical protein
VTLDDLISGGDLMSGTVELPDDAPLEGVDSEAEASLGVSGEGVEPRMSLADRMAGHIGRIAGGGVERLSQPSGNAFTDYLLAKKREGRL